MSTEVLNREELINTIWHARGKVSVVARELNVTTRTVFNYASKYATVREAIDQARQDFDEQLLDMAELALRDEIRNGRAWAIKYALDRKGYVRGYVERVQNEVSGRDGGKIEHHVTVTGLESLTDDELDVLASKD